MGACCSVEYGEVHNNGASEAATVPRMCGPEIEINVYAQLPGDDHLTLVLRLPEKTTDLGRGFYSVAEICERCGGHSLLEYEPPTAGPAKGIEAAQFGRVLHLDNTLMIRDKSSFVRGINPAYAAFVAKRDARRAGSSRDTCPYCLGVFVRNQFEGWSNHFGSQGSCHVRHVQEAAAVQPFLEFIGVLNRVATSEQALSDEDRAAARQFRATQSFGSLVDAAHLPDADVPRAINPGALTSTCPKGVAASSM